MKNFITQARIEDERFNAIVQQHRNFRREMNLQYSQLRRKTTTTVLSLSKQADSHIRNRSIETPKTPTKRYYNHTPVNYNNYRYDDYENKENNIFRITTVHVKAKVNNKKSDNIVTSRRQANKNNIVVRPKTENSIRPKRD